MSRYWRKLQLLRHMVAGATLIAVFAAGLATTVLAENNLTDSWGQQDKPIFEHDFNLQRSMQSENTYSVVDRGSSKIIGKALWDSVQRRFTLFDAKGKYAGFIQATISELQAPQIYKQYVAYDQNNNYQGVIIKDVGGMPIPPLKPPSVAAMIGEPQPASLGTELRGQWQLFRIGNVVIEDVPDPEPRVLPWYIEGILDANQ